ncbi:MULTISPECIES: PucC family protein [Pseudomonas fluorescens group]|uniref:Major Facilitator Superfamily protein n=1 Tax=Pseudomonas fluorescens TaxID=294 RepID=A0A0D0RWW3_PSEFL|nr:MULTISPECIES: PucC family protein [Pseudomonas fluorescens group]AZE61860.1 hypothetical protein C4K02_3501 [Pseudomonas synxantha]KIR24082.1 Major Facilitator Superfamily protein [Pseudomonas fluorescens]
MPQRQVLAGGAIAVRFGARRLYMTGLLVFTLASLLCSVAGEFVRAFGRRWLIGGALMLYVTGFGLLLMGGTTPDYALIVVPMPLIGLAAGLITPAATVALMNAVPPEQAGIATGILNTAR